MIIILFTGCSSTSEGNTSTIDQAPETIVSLAPSVTETIFAIGAGDMIKGRTEYCTYPVEAEDITVVGNMTDPSIETIISLEPDIVIASTHYKVEVLDQFKDAGINVIAKDSPNTLDEIYDYTLQIGDIIGKNKEARDLVSSMKSKVENVEMLIKEIKHRPSAYYVVRTGQGGEYTAGRDTFISEVIDITGGTNIADDVTGWSYTLEKLIDNNPDIIFGSADGYNIMTNNPNYSNLNAIQNEKYIIVNTDIFNRASQRLIDEGLKILVEAFHGELVNQLDF